MFSLAAFVSSLLLICCGTAVAQNELVSEGADSIVEARQAEFFEKKVRPLLAQRCMECHSNDTELSGGLGLDSKTGWQKGGDSGPAIQTKDWENSLLWIAIEYKKPKLQMPPDSKLSDAERDIFREWLSTGAYDPRLPLLSTSQKKSVALSVQDAQQHWAYRPLPPSKPINESESNEESIDGFLDAQQNREEIAPNPLADLRTLKQRLALDLHGLRSSVVEVAKIETESPDDAYANSVNRFLASPHFGERMARRWMDVVRFAESVTLRGFILPDAWRYRDYLIDSFNADKPFDTFVREQIAGDLMSSEDRAVRRQQLAATTMLALGDTNLEEQDKKQLEMDYVDEQLDMIGKVFLAQTIGCARCHDHKFDPIPTADYYALAGILKSSVAMEHANISKWIRLPLPIDDAEEAQFKALNDRQEELKTQLAGLKKKTPASPKSNNVVALEDLSGIVVDDLQATKVGVWKASASVKSYVGDGYLHDENNDKGQKSISFEPKSLPTGNYRVRLSYAYGENRSKATVVRVFSADGEDLVRIDQTKEPSEDKLWSTLGTYRFEEGGQAFVIVSNEDSVGHVVADAIQFLPESPAADTAASAKTIASVDATAKTAQEETESEKDLREKANKLEAELKEVQKQLDKRPMVMSVRASEKPVDLPIHVRGSVHQLGEVIPRGFLTCLSAAKTNRVEGDANGRLELAQWLANRDNPLTARVYVNRVWSWLMGEGLVRTIDNFGTTGDQPTNEPLLNWLTNRFVEHGWSTKWLVREIVMSKAYRRTSRATAAQLELDPENRTFARGYVRRLDAESLRDSLLLLSGELLLTERPVSKIPENLKDDFGFKMSPVHRSVYGPWFRNSLPELYSEFDGANPCFPVSKRTRSTIAQQALALLNSPFVAERAEKIAVRLLSQKDSSDYEKIVACFQSILLRDPSVAEVEWVKSQLKQDDPKQSIWIGVIQNLIASIDFRYVE